MEKISKRDKVNWQDCKKFKHFDNPLKTYEDIPGDTKNCLKNTEKCEKLQKNVSNSEAVAKHSFYPLIAFNITERRISKIKAMQGEISFLNNKIAIETDKDKKKEYEERLDKLQKNFKSKITKTRPIRYASHSDGHIYAYYAREVLLPRYESLIKKHNLEKEILAYRAIPDEHKNDENFCRRSNVTMAKEIFSQIISRGCNCVALAYDLESYYDTIDHKHLKKAWCKVLGVDNLPPDHYNIYKSLTRYCYVDLKTICKYFNYKKYCCSPDGKVCGNCDLCKTPKTYKLPKTLFEKPCDFRKFREACNKNQFLHNPGLSDTNHPCGIPQGSALSSVLSNIYLLEFDIAVRDFLKIRNAVYRRYCDDIMIICDISDKDDINEFIHNQIQSYGHYLKIHKIEEDNKYSKSQIYDFTNKEKIKKQPLQYLGFCFDGEFVTIRGSSLNRYYRKANKGAIASRLTVLRKLYEMKKNGEKLKNKHRELYRRKLYELYTDLGKNNFHSYIDRAFKGMEGVDNSKIKHQLSQHRKKVKRDIDTQDQYIKIAWDILNNIKELPDYKDYEDLVYSTVNLSNKPKHKKATKWFDKIKRLHKKFKIFSK